MVAYLSTGIDAHDVGESKVGNGIGRAVGREHVQALPLAVRNPPGCIADQHVPWPWYSLPSVLPLV